MCFAHAIILFRRGQPGYLALLLARKETEFLAPGLREGLRVKKPVLGSQLKEAETMMKHIHSRVTSPLCGFLTFSLEGHSPFTTQMST